MQHQAHYLSLNNFVSELWTTVLWRKLLFCIRTNVLAQYQPNIQKSVAAKKVALEDVSVKNQSRVSVLSFAIARTLVHYI